jgi:PilZ domain-containing protein
MPISIRPFRRFSVQCLVTYYAGRFQRQDTMWNISPTGSRLSGDLSMRPGEILSLTVSLLNEQCIGVPQAIVRWSRGQESAVENVMVERHTYARLQHYVKGLAQELTEIVR